MKLKDREKFLLGMVVEEYINNGEPISSKFLVKKYNFKLSPATIRFELQKLTEGGYLYQPHTSAGRVPSDKGYRFFIDELMKPFPLELCDSGLIKNVLEKTEDDAETDVFNKELIKIIAQISKDLVMMGSLRDNEVYYDGVLNLFQKPEFQETRRIRGIFEMVESFKNNLEESWNDIENLVGDMRVFIGKENPFYKAEDYSIIISKFEFSKEKSKKDLGILAILGPKRMRYNKNISLLNFISNFDHDF